MKNLGSIPPAKIENKEKIKTIEVEIEGKKYSLEYTSSNFEYPKNIQEETGILGYERKMIPENELLKVMKSCFSDDQKKIIKKKTGFDLNNISTLEQLQEFKKSPERQKLDHELFMETIENFSKNLLLATTDNQFPSESFNYVMGGSQEERDQFVEDKFLLQGVYGFESYQKLKTKSLNPFEMKDKYNSDYTGFMVFDKSSDKVIDESPNSISNVFKPYQNAIANDQVSVISANGLNVSDKTFFFDYNLLDDTPAFGFSRKEKFFQDYIDKSIERLRKINKDNLHEDGKPKKDKRLLFGDRLFVELFGIKESENSTEHLSPLPYGIEEVYFLRNVKGKTLELLKKYGSPISKKDNSSARKYEETRGGYGDDEYERYKRSLHEIAGIKSMSYHLPVFINDKEVSQLRWGDASYASFLTKNGFNVLEIKHAEKFPAHS